MAPTLLVLAAGMGSRYGGLKQIDPVGPSGETMLDYAVFDAIRAGFARVVFVVRKEFEGAFRSAVTAKYAGRIEVELVYQSLDDLPPGFDVPAGREKPWGTGHAVWCARSALSGPFAVINADDFYGASSYAGLADIPRQGAAGCEFAIVGFRLANTLSENGTVSRGVCACRAAGSSSITEQKAIARSDVGPGASVLRRGDRLHELLGIHARRSSTASTPGCALFLAASGSGPEGGVLSSRGGFRPRRGRLGDGRRDTEHGFVVRHHLPRGPGRPWRRRSGRSSTRGPIPAGSSAEAALVSRASGRGGAGRPRWGPL